MADQIARANLLHIEEESCVSKIPGVGSCSCASGPAHETRPDPKLLGGRPSVPEGTEPGVARPDYRGQQACQDLRGGAAFGDMI